MPLHHISLPLTNQTLEEASKFYLDILSPLGYQVFMEVEDKSVGFNTRFGGPDFWIHVCPEEKKGEGKKGEKRGVHVAFSGRNQVEVQRFYERALKAGATPNGPPGFRPQYTEGYYAAFVIDPEGNNLECVSYNPWWMTLLRVGPGVLGAVVVGVGAWLVGRGGF